MRDENRATAASATGMFKAGLFWIRSRTLWFSLDSPQGSRGGSVLADDMKQHAQNARMKAWLPPRDSNPDMLSQSQLSCR
jgi:hypothetical protein